MRLSAVTLMEIIVRNVCSETCASLNFKETFRSPVNVNTEYAVER